MTRGPVWDDGRWLRVAEAIIRWANGDPRQGATSTLTVVSRAPRPLYINHPRTHPMPGDVVLDEEADLPLIVFRVAGRLVPDMWIDQYGIERTYEHLSPPRQLRLLVDGETHEAVR